MRPDVRPTTRVTPLALRPPPVRPAVPKLPAPSPTGRAATSRPRPHWVLVAWCAAIGGCIDRPALAAEPALAPITAASIAPDDQTVVVGSNAGVQLLSWPDLQPAGELKTGARHVHDLEFAPDEARLAIVGGSPGEQGVVELFSWPMGTCLGRFAFHSDVLYGAAWHPRLDQLAVGGAGGELAVLDASSGQVLQECRGHVRDVLAVSWLANVCLVSASADQSLRLWNPGAEEAAHALSNHTAAVTGVAVAPAAEQHSEDRLLEAVSIGRDRTVRLWQPLRRRLVRLVRLSSEPLDVCWTHHPSLVAVACADGCVRLIDVRRAQVAAEPPAIEGWAYCVVQHADRWLFVAGERAQVARLAWPWP